MIRKVPVHLLLAIAGVLVFVATSQASSLFPPCPQVGNANGCNEIITIPLSGTPTVAPGFSTPYDGLDDQIVGVINNSSSTIFALTLSGTNIFAFDGDGAWADTSANLCTTPAGGGPFGCLPGPLGPTGYEGPHTTFTIIDFDHGAVNFVNGIPPGGHATFSLEAPTLGAFTVSVGSPVPEPSSLVLLGSGLLAVGGALKRRLRP